MPHVEEKSCEDVQVECHNVSQRQNQHHHIYQMTWVANGTACYVDTHSKVVTDYEGTKVGFSQSLSSEMLYFAVWKFLAMLTSLIRLNEMPKC